MQRKSRRLEVDPDYGEATSNDRAKGKDGIKISESRRQPSLPVIDEKKKGSCGKISTNGREGASGKEV